MGGAWWRFGTGCAALLLAGCAETPFWSRSGEVEPDLARAIRDHYEARAVEEQGRCADPHFDGEPFYRVLERDDGSLLVRVEYRYRDRFATDRPELRRLEPEVPTELVCRGYGQRDVEMVRSAAGGWQVARMSGLSRE